MTLIAEWLERHTNQAPPALRARVTFYALHAAGPSLPLILASAGQTALQEVLEHSGDRSAALDLLAADALITLALLAQAESSPDRMEELATSVLQTSRSGA
ncbi:MAG: hypothetical protein ACJ8BF_03880 [Gemmatimonadales bacterium]